MPVMQITRTSEANKSPVSGSLAPGQLAVEMGTPTRLWVGVTAADDVLLQKKLYDSADAGGAFLPLSGGTLTGPLAIESTAQNWGSYQMGLTVGSATALNPGMLFSNSNTTTPTLALVRYAGSLYISYGTPTTYDGDIVEFGPTLTYFISPVTFSNNAGTEFRSNIVMGGSTKITNAPSATDLTIASADNPTVNASQVYIRGGNATGATGNGAGVLIEAGSGPSGNGSIYLPNLPTVTQSNTSAIWNNAGVLNIGAGATGGGGMAEPTGAGTWARKETGVWERGVAIVGDEMAGDLRFQPLGSGHVISAWGMRGDPVAGGNGRQVEMSGGSGKVGGEARLNGGAGTGGNGGQVALLGGESDVMTGGSAQITAGFSLNGQGGSAYLNGGDGLLSGIARVSGGDATKNNGVGGNASIYGGNAPNGLGTGGGVEVRGGVGNGTGGLVFITAGDSASEGGPVTIQGGTATIASGVPGNIVLVPGRNALDATKFGNVLIQDLPTTAPAVASALWRDPVTNALMITP